MNFPTIKKRYYLYNLYTVIQTQIQMKYKMTFVTKTVKRMVELYRQILKCTPKQNSEYMQMNAEYNLM